MNELLRVECKTDFNTMDVIDDIVVFATPFWGRILIPRKHLFVFYEDRFEIYRKDKLMKTVMYSDIILEKTIIANARGVAFFIRSEKSPTGDYEISMAWITPEQKKKILEIVGYNQ